MNPCLFMAAKHHQNIAEMFEADGVNLEEAVSHYEQAAKYYRGEENNPSANKCLLKVAQYAAQLENYEKAISIYQQVASSSLESALLNCSTKEYLFRAALCHLCLDIPNTLHAIEFYIQKYPGFQDSREYKLIQTLIEYIEEQNMEGFTEAVTDYASVSPLDEWFIMILLRIKKKHINIIPVDVNDNSHKTRSSEILVEAMNPCLFMAAKHHQNIADMFEADGVNLEEAVSHYEQAAKYYRGEENNPSANKCLLKVAQYAAQLENYEKAISIYQQVASSSLESALLNCSTKEYLFRAALCHLCLDIPNTLHAIEFYIQKYPGFQDSREYKLIQTLIEYIEEQNMEGFTEAVTDYASVSPLDEWFIMILLRIKKKHINIIPVGKVVSHSVDGYSGWGSENDVGYWCSQQLHSATTNLGIGRVINVCECFVFNN